METAVSERTSREVDIARVACAGIAALVILAAVAVKAPGLGIVALPFLVGAIAYRGRRAASTIVLLVFAALLLLINVNFIIANGFDAVWSDLLSVFGGTILAVVLAAALVRHLSSGRRDAR